MRFSRTVWLLAGHLTGLGWAATANLKIWEIDASCTNYHDGTFKDTTGLTGGDDYTDYLQESFNVALDIFIAAKDSLTYALQRRPNRLIHKKKYNKWIRIADSMAVTLGFYPKRYKTEKPTDEYWVDVLAVYDKAITTLQASENIKGYSDYLDKELPGHKPLIIYGDNWDWVGNDDKVPGSKRKLKDYFGKSFVQDGAVGAWFKHHRFDFVRTEKEKPILCGTDIFATTNLNWDLITFCDSFFSAKGLRLLSPATIKDKKLIRSGDSITTYTGHLSYHVAHEFTHWFGGVINKKNQPVIDDINAVTEDCNMIYEVEDGIGQVSEKKLTAEELEDKGWIAVIAYGRRLIWSLARPNKKEGSDEKCGPKQAIRNADSLAMFALMMYFDEWNWAEEGLARDA